MKTLNDYMEMSYRLELVEDKEEGGYVASFRICLVVSLAAIPLRKRSQTRRTRKRHGSKLRWKKG